jgi:hypothetical protein
LDGWVVLRYYSHWQKGSADHRYIAILKKT